jgi:hypothetical protein
MTDFEELAIEEALRSELGKTVSFVRYGRQNRTPMTIVLDEVERQIGPRFSVYWVDGGSPEVFTLTGFSPSPVVFSTRYLSLTAFIRHLFVEDFQETILVDIAERTALKIMAELALRHGDPDYATLAFVKSATGKGVWLNDDNQVMQLEYEPKNEAYMATWFYGLVHELGHLHPHQTQDFSGNDLFSDAEILDTIKVALDYFPSYPDSFKHEAIQRAQQRRSESVLGIDHVRSEGLADTFAASVLFKTTFDIMREINQESFEVLNFIQEMIIFLNIIAVIDRCRRVASIASTTTVDREAGFEMALHPVAVAVRTLMQRRYLELAVTTYLFDTHEPTREQSERVQSLFDQINEHYIEIFNVTESGIARAMEFSLFPERRENDWALLEAFRKDLSNSPVGLLEARRFCELADALGADGKLLQALKGIVDDPKKSLSPDPKGDLIYFVPWVEGPDDFDRPFGLDTKYGHLVFVFHHQGELYEAFFKSSAETLGPGFTLKEAAIPVAREERLGPELAPYLPGGERFLIVVEGTEVFAQCMQELAEDTIWED